MISYDVNSFDNACMEVFSIFIDFSSKMGLERLICM